MRSVWVAWVALALISVGCDRALPLPETASAASGRVSCGELLCQPGELCHICDGQNGIVLSELCVSAPAQGTYVPCPGGNALNVFCDDNADCGDDHACRLVPGDTVNLFACSLVDRTRPAWCYQTICHSDDDCQICGLSCRDLAIDPMAFYRMCQ
jgi:hypothetical protein